MDIVNVLKALSDESRIRILNILNKRDVCVCEMQEILGLTQTNISKHLSKLKDLKLVVSEKQGQYVFCSINKQALRKYPFIRAILDSETSKDKTLKKDAKIFEKMNSKGMVCERDKCCRK